jgi:hypothetical protein
MDRLGDSVQRELARFDGRGAMPRILAAWPAAVGSEVARNAWPARVARDGTLHVNTSSSVWAFELGQLAPALLEQLRASLGDLSPTALRFAQGHLPEPPAEPAGAAPRERNAPSAAAVADAAALAAGIENGELRERVARAAALSLCRRLPAAGSGTL